MRSLTQIAWGVCAVLAFGTIAGAHASPAASTAQDAANYRDKALGLRKPLAQFESAERSRLRTLMRQDTRHDAAGADGQWFSRDAYPGQMQAGRDAWTSYELQINAGAAPISSAVRHQVGTLPLAAGDTAREVHAEPGLLRSVFSYGVFALLAYAAYLATLAVFQKRFVFNANHAEGPAAEPADTHELTPVRLALTQDKAIKGWFLRPRQGKAPYPSIIYYGGRTEEVSWLRGAVKWFPHHALLALNYRGYGESDGDPSEHALFEDALAQFDWLVAQHGVDPGGVVLVGRSLGTGVASYVAANRPAERVVLITPYDSLLALARRRFRFTPLSLLLRHQFKSVDYARTNMQPCLALLAEQDDVVPEEHTLRLMAAWAGAKELVRIPSTTHMDIPYQAATLTAVAAWLGYASIPPGPLSLVAPAS